LEKEQFAMQIVVRCAHIYSQKEDLLQSNSSFGNLPFQVKRNVYQKFRFLSFWQQPFLGHCKTKGFTRPRKAWLCKEEKPGEKNNLLAQIDCFAKESKSEKN
jgi:hypothetical protein